MTTVDTTMSLRQRREAIVYEHAAAENRHDVEATIASFHQPRYEFNGQPTDGAQAVRELLGGFMTGFPDLHIEPTRIRHLDDGVLVEGTITGTHAGQWAGIPPTRATCGASGRGNLRVRRRPTPLRESPHGHGHAAQPNRCASLTLAPRVPSIGVPNFVPVSAGRLSSR